MLFTLFVALQLSNVGTVHASEYDPHQQLNLSSWFEGWYTRVVTSSGSFGLIAGYTVGSRVNGTLASLLHYNSTSRSLRVFETFPPTVTIRKNGEPVHQDPDFPSPPSFSYVCQGGSCKLSVDEGGVQFSLHVDGRQLSVKSIGPSTFWGPHGASPEGLAALLPLDLHWFVYSLSTPVSWMYTQQGKEGITVTDSGIGYAHMEKNWGMAFPDAWVWAQGLQVHPHNNSIQASFALAGGRLPTRYKTVSRLLPNLWLLGYRSDSQSLDFHPYTSLFHTDIRPCAGEFTITATSLSSRLEVHIKADPASFSPLSCPTELGFRQESVESYAGVAQMRLYRRSLLGGLKLMAQHTLHQVALEFGGASRCPENGDRDVVDGERGVVQRLNGE